MKTTHRDEVQLLKAGINLIIFVFYFVQRMISSLPLMKSYACKQQFRFGMKKAKGGNRTSRKRSDLTQLHLQQESCGDDDDFQNIGCS